ncbi:MAG: hypothetical protein FWF18_02820 [Dehalococcoidia bacterium]|nr:hypothetical protein [Dehalococcoidia bacterium]
MTGARLTVFAGHYGSGKTLLAINYAARLKKEAPDRRVRVVDMDIVNPYFRSADAGEAMVRLGVEVIASAFAGGGLEAPALPAEIMSVFDDKESLAVIDLGGDDRGALALGSYAKQMNETDSRMLLVCNCYRPLSKEPVMARRIKEEIEAASGVRFAGLVNNSNLAAETTALDVSRSFAYMREVSALCGLPVLFTACRQDLLPELEAGEVAEHNLFGLSIFYEKWGFNNAESKL